MIVCHYSLDMLTMMLRTAHLGMDNGDFVFIYYALAPRTYSHFFPWNPQMKNLTSEQLTERMRLFRNYKMVNLGQNCTFETSVCNRKITTLSPLL